MCELIELCLPDLVVPLLFFTIFIIIIIVILIRILVLLLFWCRLWWCTLLLSLIIEFLFELILIIIVILLLPLGDPFRYLFLWRLSLVILFVKIIVEEIVSFGSLFVGAHFNSPSALFCH